MLSCNVCRHCWGIGKTGCSEWRVETEIRYFSASEAPRIWERLRGVCATHRRNTSEYKSSPAARGSRPYCMRPKASKCERSFFTYFRNFRYNVNFRHHPQILALQIAAKPLQIATLILLTVYRNLPTPHPTVTSLTSYDVPFSHNAYVTDDRLTDRRTTERTISATISTVG